MRRLRKWWWLGALVVVAFFLGTLITPQARMASFAAKLEGRQDYDEFASGGGRAMAAQEQSKSVMMAAATPGFSAGASSAPAGQPPAKPSTLATEEANRPDHYLIKNATLTIEVKNARAAADGLLADVKARGGYVVSMNETADSLGSRTVTVSVRVPAFMFDGFSRGVDSLGKVLNKQVTADDVTEEYVDSDSRLRNLKRTEDRLLTHLSQTGRLSDTLLVEKELTRVRGDIEELEGRLRFLKNRVDFSTITATLQEAARQQPLVEAQTFSSGKVFSDAVRSLVDFAQSLWSIVIWIAIWAVVWLPLLCVVVYAAYRAQRAGRHLPGEPPSAA